MDSMTTFIAVHALFSVCTAAIFLFSEWYAGNNTPAEAFVLWVVISFIPVVNIIILLSSIISLCTTVIEDSGIPYIKGRVRK